MDYTFCSGITDFFGNVDLSGMGNPYDMLIATATIEVTAISIS